MLSLRISRMLELISAHGTHAIILSVFSASEQPRHSADELNAPLWPLESGQVGRTRKGMDMENEHEETDCMKGVF